MKVIAAYALLVLGGKASPSSAEVEKIIKDAGAQADFDQINILVNALEGKEFHELVQVGMETLANIHGSSAKADPVAVQAVAVEEAPVEQEDEIELYNMFDDDEY